MKLAVILGTVRQGRQSEKQAKWVVKTAKQLDSVEVELLDLKDYPMPFFEEPISPRYNPNREPTGVVKQWLDKLDRADAYLVVSPEYNHSIPGVLKNAFDHVDFQMNRKPSAIVTHGTVGGARAAMHLKEVLSESKSMPIPDFVAFANMSDSINEQGNLSEDVRTQPYGPQASLQKLLTELRWYSDALEGARQKA